MSASLTGVIEEGCEFEGNIYFRGVFRLGGRFKGEIRTPDTLIISETADVEAKVHAGTVVISGRFQGEVFASQRVEVHRPAHVRGNISTPSLSVDEGVVFEGSSKVVQSSEAPSRSAW